MTDCLPIRAAARDIALECGVKYGMIRLPEDGAFDPAPLSRLRTVVDRFWAPGLRSGSDRGSLA